MQKMFQSATLKLTAWYLAILMTISITFSIVIYQLNSRELKSRLENLQHSLIDTLPIIGPDGQFRFGFGPGTAYFDESSQAANQMALSLVYINAFVFIAGGLGSYFLARRTLRPIEAAHESQSRFTSDASHELRTPLAAMKAEIEVTLRDPKLSSEEAREVLESNLEEVEKLIQLSQMLLHLSRLDHDKLEFTRVDFAVELEELLKRYPEHKDRFEITTRKKVVTQANEAAVSELMSILIENALKYSPDGSKIHIKLFSQRGNVGFEIRNSGVKIPEDKIPKLFDRFYRADVSRTNSSKNGYGLGLSIAKKIADVHHGYLTVTSTEKETTFTFFLPLARKSQTKA